MEVSSLHRVFPNLVVCKFHAGALLCTLILWAFLHSLLPCISALCALLRLSVSDSVQGDHVWELHITVELLCSQVFSGDSACTGKVPAYCGKVCLSTSTNYKQNGIRPRKVSCREGSSKSMTTLQNEASCRLQNLETLACPRFFCSKPLTMLGLLGFLFCIGHPQCWIFKGFCAKTCRIFYQ